MVRRKKVRKENQLMSCYISTSTLFNKNSDYNRLAHKITIANLGGPVKRKIKGKESKKNISS